MIKDNILEIKGRVKSACSKINIDPNSIIVVCISKNRTIEQIKEVIGCGLSDIGENRVQEAIAKHNAIGNSAKQSEASPQEAQYAQRMKWHMVGCLQTNKVKEAVKIFDLIHSVSSLALAQEIGKQAARINKVQEILVEIKTSPEAAKSGIKPEKTVEFVQQVSKLANIRVMGLMTIAPLVDDPQNSRPYFRILPQLRDKINNLQLANCDLRLLSMGMSGDFEIAIEEGSNMIRLGRAIFGE